jgi:hypothetical protein
MSTTVTVLMVIFLREIADSWVPVAHPAIPATQDAEIRQIVLETLSQKSNNNNKNPSQKGLVEWLKV